MSELADRMQADLVAAMKARDDLVRSTLRMAMTAIKNEEVAGTEARELSDNEVLGVLNREVAKRRDSAEAYTAGNRPELAEKELAEVEVLQRYLPAALTDAELDAIVAEEVAAAAAQAGEALTMRQMGLVIKAVNARAASSRKRQFNPESAKYDLRVLLLRLGMIGEEFKTARQHLLANMPGDAAFKTRAQREKHTAKRNGGLVMGETIGETAAATEAAAVESTYTGGETC